jgi:hypothetical protein
VIHADAMVFTSQPTPQITKPSTRHGPGP